MYLELVPSQIRFMHHEINNRFRDGRSVNQTVYDIENGLMNVDDLPMIRVVRRNGRYYAFDNRRLYVFRVLENRGCLRTVTVLKASSGQFQPRRFTTLNNGISITVRGDVTLPHAVAISPSSFDSDREVDSFAEVSWMFGRLCSLDYHQQ
ncbi:uncharacterized protein LOC143462991 [Clavelina lepadiformis]|uniref:uncharacterized protein LOC143462991 n=1 Tax=Clavelina lepadiformis TaxID=159417 RepID=UPI0040421545